MHTPLLIRQRLPSDCGVASLAMLANITYEEAYTAFVKAGLSEARPRRAAFASNFTDLRLASKYLGLDASMLRFKSWDAIATRAILKVMTQKNRNWHWVVGARSSTGIVIYDPSSDLQAFERDPVHPDALNFSLYRPAGNILVLRE